jgi:hypothetical protein
MGALSSLLGGDEDTELKLPDQYHKSMNELLKLAGQAGYQTTPVRGIAPLDTLQRFAQSLATKYASSGTSPALSTAISEATKTATAPIDITKMPEFSGIMSKILSEGQDEGNRLLRSLNIQSPGAAGSPERDILGRNVTETQERLTSALSNLFAQLRGLKSTAVSQLGSFAGQEEASAISKIDVASRAGALSQQLEQLIADAMYEKQMNDINMKYSVTPDIYKGILGNTQGTITGGGPNAVSRFLQTFGQIAPLAFLAGSNNNQSAAA